MTREKVKCVLLFRMGLIWTKDQTAFALHLHATQSPSTHKVFNIVASVFLHLYDQVFFFFLRIQERWIAPYHFSISSWLLFRVSPVQIFGENPALSGFSTVCHKFVCPKNLGHFQKDYYIMESSLSFCLILLCFIYIFICVVYVGLLSKEPHITDNKVTISGSDTWDYSYSYYWQILCLMNIFIPSEIIFSLQLSNYVFGILCVRPI